MYFSIALYKFDACRVFPVSHGLFEECFMQATEIAIDLIGYDTIIPDAFLFGSYGTSYTMMLFQLLQLELPVDDGERQNCGNIKIFMQQLWENHRKVLHGVCVILIARSFSNNFCQLPC